MWVKLELTLAPPRSKGFVKVWGSLMMKWAASWEKESHPDAGAQVKDGLSEAVHGCCKEKSIVSVWSPRKGTLIQSSHRVSWELCFYSVTI